MYESFIDFPMSIANNKASFENKNFNKIIQNYNFFVIHDNTLNDEKTIQTINKNISDSKILTINSIKNMNQNTDKNNFIICFEKTIIIFKQSELTMPFIQSLFLNNSDLSICYLSDSKKYFLNEKIPNNEIEIDSQFKEEIANLKSKFTLKRTNNPIKNIWPDISQCLCAYLIKKSYNHYNFNRCKYASSTPETIHEYDYVKLRNLGIGSSFTVELIYYIEKGELRAIKKPNILDIEIPKLIERESNNYSKIKHPFIPIFYGIVKDKRYIVIEYIKGHTLKNIDKVNLSENDVFTLIFELILIVEFFHYNHFIIRDLKPDNIMIDDHYNVIMIDFDRVIGFDNNSNINFTCNITAKYTAPEVNKNNDFSYKSDIYSLGKMIEYLVNKSNKIYDCLEIKNIYEKCLNESAEKRPSIKDLLNEYFHKFYKHIDMKYITNIYEEFVRNNLDDKITNYQIKTLFFLGYIFDDSKYITKDINKAIYYYSLAADQNDSIAQFNLGLIYEKGEYITRDMNKAIYYYTLSADQNDSDAQFKLGQFYEKGECITRDMNKAIHYYTLAADQNDSDAQFNLGLIYEKGECITRDTNKAIHYYTLAADQNDSDAQFRLGQIYENGKYVTININKAIHYYTLAADQNNSNAQFNLGQIYENGEYITRNINKAIHYYTLAANQNNAFAQFILGFIYEKGLFVTQDIKKSIYYYSLAANQNNIESQAKLGLLYLEGKYFPTDINKAIHYLSLAANQNHIESQAKLGLLYLEGKYFPTDINKAIHYLSPAANQNNQIAQVILGLLYLEGKYFPSDINKAFNFFQLAANQNSCHAQFFLGLLYFEGKYTKRDINKAIYYLKLASNQNHYISHFILGYIYSDGKYIPRDIYQAIHYFTLAANKNYQDAQLSLGIIYSQGKFVEQNINKAIHYYSLAAQQNNSQAQYNLGLIYYDGIQVKRNINKGIHYFTLAASQMDVYALLKLAHIYSKGLGVQKNINKSNHYYILAAKQNNSFAQLRLGISYYYGLNVTQNIQKGVNYIILASKNGDPIANFAHGFLLHEGKNIERNIKEAIHYYKEASCFNNNYAKNNLGIIYKHGYNGIKGQSTISIEYFEEAIHQENDLLSMYNLAHIYIYDDTIKKDINKSIELLIKSSKFYHSKILLGIILIKKFGFDTNKIRNEIEKITIDKNNPLSLIICNIVNYLKTLGQSVIESLYEYYRTVDFLYNIINKEVLSSDLENFSGEYKSSSPKNISSLFFEGFGFDIQ